MKATICKLLEAFLYIAFFLIVLLATVAFVGVTTQSRTLPALVAVPLGLTFGLIAGVITTGFGFIFISMHENLQALRAVVTGQGEAPAQPPALGEWMKRIGNAAAPPQPVYFYLDADNAPAGPLSLSTLHAMLDAAQIAPDTRVARKGDTQWQPLRSVLDTAGGKG